MIRLSPLCFALLIAVPASAQDPEFNGRKLSVWIAQLKEDPVVRKRRAAAVALGQIASENKDFLTDVMNPLGKALRNDSSSAVREQAANVIGQLRIEKEAGGILLDLTESLRVEKEPAVKREVAATLGRFGPASRQAVKPLTDALRDPDAGVRAAAADALGRIGADARPAATDLLTLAKDTDKTVKQAAIFALGRVDAEDVAAVSEVLVAVIKGSDADLRREAVVGLGFLGDRSTEVVKAIAGLLTDKDAAFRQQVVLTLHKFNAAARNAEPELTRLAKTDPDKLVRTYAIRALCISYGTEAKAMIPLLTERLKADEDFDVRVAIVGELAALGPDGKSAVPALREAQRDPQIKVRDAAAAAIKRIEKPPAKPGS